MRSNVRDGKLIREPESLERACRRREQIVSAIANIGEQLYDQPNRRAEMIARGQDYVAWRVTASKKMREFETERRLLAEWIIERVPANETLFRGAYELIKRLQKEIDFYPEEEVLITALDAKFGPGENRG